MPGPIWRKNSGARFLAEICVACVHVLREICLLGNKFFLALLKFSSLGAREKKLKHHFFAKLAWSLTCRELKRAASAVQLPLKTGSIFIVY
jgi:hypothetical protein